MPTLYTFSTTLTPDTSKLDATLADLWTLIALLSNPGYSGSLYLLDGAYYLKTISVNVNARNWAQKTNDQAYGDFNIKQSNALGGDPIAAGTSGLYIDPLRNVYVSATYNSNPGIGFAPSGSMTIGNSAQASGWVFANFTRSNAVVGSITQSGTTATLYSTTSDRRLKRNIVDAPECGDIIDAIKVRSFNWDGDADEHVTHGFVAQELVLNAPQAVKVGDNDEDVTDAWAVDPSKLVALLWREVQALRARVAVLEAA